MKKSEKRLILENIFLLIPLILYAIYKNGYLIYTKKLISIISIFKPLYLVLISIGIKIIIDLIRYRKIKLDYNFVYVVLVAMLMPYNINYIIYTITLTITYILSLLLHKFKFNKVCFMYLIIILIQYLISSVSFKTPLEVNYEFSYSFIDYFFGRNIGGISTTSIILSCLALVYLLFDYYYKKEIPLVINITYLILAFIYYFITSNSGYLLNSEVIFASIFISSLPEFSPYNRRLSLLYGISIGVFTFILCIVFNKIVAVYIVIFILSLFNLVSLIANKNTMS